MTTKANNLLITLNKWAYRQDENFVTDAFAHLLQYLLENESSAAIFLLNKLTNNRLALQKEETSHVDIRTQVTRTTGRPDMEIVHKNHLVLVEVKVGSDLGFDQFDRYLKELNEEGRYSETTLVLLTRDPISVAMQPDVYCRWYIVSDWLDDILNNMHLSDVCVFLLTSFNDFLKEKKMAIEKVGWQMTEGLNAFQNFINMVGEALDSQNIPVTQRSASWTATGYYFHIKYSFVGVYFTEPHVLMFEFNTEKQLSEGAIKEGSIKDDRYWVNKLDLESEESHFFARSKGSQMQLIEKFLKDSWDLAQQI